MEEYVYLVCGLPVYNLRTTFYSDGVTYNFHGIINRGLFRHVMPPEHVWAIESVGSVNDNE